MDRTAIAAATAATTADAALTAPGTGAPLLEGMPQQRGPAAGVTLTATGTSVVVLAPAATAVSPGAGASAATVISPAVGTPAAIKIPEAEGPAPAPAFVPAPARAPGGLAGLRALRPWRLLPTPTGTPFTFGYAVLLFVTSLVTDYADPSFVDALQQASSTDVAHLALNPVLVLVASALWIVGGMTSPYAVVFLLVLTALERRIGGWRAAGVFLFGHVVATLATEVPVGLSVLVGYLPDSSLHRLDYGISFGVAASVGSLAGLLTPWLRWPVLALFGGTLVEDLITFEDPMTNWGHLIALGIGISTWPLVRRWRRTVGATAA